MPLIESATQIIFTKPNYLFVFALAEFSEREDFGPVNIRSAGDFATARGSCEFQYSICSTEPASDRQFVLFYLEQKFSQKRADTGNEDSDVFQVSPVFLRDCRQQIQFTRKQ